MIETDTARRVRRLLPPMTIGLVAALLLFWSLDARYLWQDEAQTAVLATRLLRFGKPLAYDGVNFIGLDVLQMEQLEPLEPRTRNARDEVAYYIRHGYLKADTTWKWQPWGQFVTTALSIRLLGQTTLAARLPFAMAGLITVLLLYYLALEYGAGIRIASAAAVLLIFNPYWILHARQCRYYSLSSLFLVLTFLCYAYWQRGGKWGIAAFVASAWCWFQMDYGTFWPVLLVLFVDALIAHWRRPWPIFAAGSLLAAAVAPFAWYYELWGRRGFQGGTWTERFRLNLSNTNEYVIPVLVLAAALILLVWRWKRLSSPERRLIAVSCGTVLALGIWVPTMAPASFLRYTIMAAPVACLISAWFLVGVVPNSCRWALWPAIAVLILAPWASMPLHLFMAPPGWYGQGRFLRSELVRMKREIFENSVDVNRETIDWLRDNADPADEILINYEDLPLMYYLPNPVRGGIAAFRAEDDARTPPRFLVLRPNIGFVDWPIYLSEARRYRWSRAPVTVPSAVWGNNPDPMSALTPPHQPDVLIFRRVGD